MDANAAEGRWRRAAGSAFLLVFLLAYIVGAVTLSQHVAGAPWWAQLAFYAVAGFAWTLPLKPLFVWMGGRRRS